MHGSVASSAGTSSTVTAVMVVSGLAIALFITQGFSTAVCLSEELENPRRNAARTVLATLAISSAVILVPVIAKSSASIATLYWALYLRPRRESRWLVSIPEDAHS